MRENMTLYNCQKPKTSKKDKFLLKITSVGKPLSGNIFKAFSFKMKYISTTLKKKKTFILPSEKKIRSLRKYILVTQMQEKKKGNINLVSFH